MIRAGVQPRRETAAGISVALTAGHGRHNGGDRPTGRMTMIATRRQYVTIERHSVSIEKCPWSERPWWVAHYTDRAGHTHGFGGITSQEAQDKARADIVARIERQRVRDADA